MLFSVIIPTYNRAELLKQTLHSVFAQKGNDYEVIVVDDGSTDDTEKLVQEYGSQVQLFKQENKGPGVARNLGAKYAKGEYLAFLDSDDLWFPWSLGTYQTVINRWNHPAFIAGKPYQFRERSDLAAVIGDDAVSHHFSDYLASGDQWRWWGASSFVVRKDAFDSVTGFANRLINGEDADLALRLGEARGFVHVTAPATFGYRKHPVSEMKNFGKTLAGTWHQINSEKESKYPGGVNRSHERWRILTRHARPVSLECLAQRMGDEAWQLYRTTFAWNLKIGRWRYLTGFPLKAALTSA